ncbi:MAG: thioredoxin domain-containing protein [Microbacteriaceae bacterium]
MSNAGSGSRPSKNARREAAREKARALREAQKKKDRRNRVLLQGGIGVAVLAVLAIVAFVIVTSIRPPASGPKNMASDGIVIGKGLKAIPTAALSPNASPVPSIPDSTASVVNIRTYIDYLCPYCGQFEKTNAKQLADLAKSGAGTIEVHPIALLTSHSQGTKYSQRAANAAACVANYSPDQFYAFHISLFENQPQENSAGLTSKKLKDMVKAAGAKNLSSIDSCIDDGKFNGWVQSATDRAISDPIPNSDLKKFTGTPTVLVNGKQYTGSLTSSKEFAAFVLQASSDTYSTSTPTPTPAP